MIEILKKNALIDFTNGKHDYICGTLPGDKRSIFRIQDEAGLQVTLEFDNPEAVGNLIYKLNELYRRMSGTD